MLDSQVSNKFANARYAAERIACTESVDSLPEVAVHPNCRCSIGAYRVDEEDNGFANKQRSATEDTPITDDDIRAINHYTGFGAYDRIEI